MILQHFARFFNWFFFFCFLLLLWCVFLNVHAHAWSTQDTDFSTNPMDEECVKFIHRLHKWYHHTDTRQKPTGHRNSIKVAIQTKAHLYWHTWSVIIWHLRMSLWVWYPFSSQRNTGVHRSVCVCVRVCVRACVNSGIHLVDVTTLFSCHLDESYKIA